MTRLLSSLVATLSALVVAAAAAASASASPSVAHHAMQWQRWPPSSSATDGKAVRPGSAAVLGIDAMRDLGPLRALYHFRVIHTLPELHAAEIRASARLVATARSDPRIRYLSPIDISNRPLSEPNDPLLVTTDPNTGMPYEWQFAAARVGPALDLSAGSASIDVGTIDSGTADVPDLAGKIDARWVATPGGNVVPDTRARDYLGHGTAVASLIAANGFGMAGFGGATHIVSVRARTLTDLAVAAGLMKLDQLGVQIVNMSFGGTAPENPIVLDAIHKAEADGMLLIAAAGNSSAPVAHPAADLQPANGQESVGLAVGASDATGKLAFFSNYGDNLSLVAPGNNLGRCSGVLVAAPISVTFVSACYPSWVGADGASYAYVAGTSFAAPEVAGIAALIWAVRPSLTNYQVADIIKQSANRTAAGWTPTMGCGSLDAAAALTLATSRSDTEWAATAGSATGSSCAAS